MCTVPVGFGESIEFALDFLKCGYEDSFKYALRVEAPSARVWEWILEPTSTDVHNKLRLARHAASAKLHHAAASCPRKRRSLHMVVAPFEDFL